MSSVGEERENIINVNAKAEVSQKRCYHKKEQLGCLEAILLFCLIWNIKFVILHKLYHTQEETHISFPFYSVHTTYWFSSSFKAM